MYMRYLMDDIEADMKGRQEQEFIELLRRPDALPVLPTSTERAWRARATAAITRLAAAVPNPFRRRISAADDARRSSDPSATGVRG
jgi:hypothetical protein